MSQIISMHGDPEAAGERFRAPLFAELLGRPGPDQRRLYLELGGLAPGTLQLLQGSRCCLVVADAAEGLLALERAGDDPAALEQAIAALLPVVPTEPVDAVFCWDLLNYLSRPALGALGRALHGVLRPGALLHALIEVGGGRMPERPARFAPCAPDELIRDRVVAASVPAPRYTPWDLEKHGATLRVERSMMLTNGMQEYLLCVEGEGAGPREIPALYRSRG